MRLRSPPGLLRRDEGLGRLLRQKLMHRLFPMESSPDETQITPMNLLGLAEPLRPADRVLVQDAGRLPGSLVRDTKAEFVSLSGKGADKVTTLVVQPACGDDPMAFDPRSARPWPSTWSAKWPVADATLAQTRMRKAHVPFAKTSSQPDPSGS